MLKHSGANSQPYVLPDFKGNHSDVSPLDKMLAVNMSQIFLVLLRKNSSIISLPRTWKKSDIALEIINNKLWGSYRGKHIFSFTNECAEWWQ